MGKRRYRYATDQQIREHLISIHATGVFFTAGESYGYIVENGQQFICMDDDDELVEVIVSYLQRSGAPEMPVE